MKVKLNDMHKFMGCGVCYSRRAEALNERKSKFVKTRWVFIEKVNDIRRIFVAQWSRGLVRRRPPLFAARLLVRRRGSCPDRPLALIALGKLCAYLYPPARRPENKLEIWLDHLEKALYVPKDAPQAWFDEVSGTFSDMDLGVYRKGEWEAGMVTHVEDLLCSGSRKYDLKGAMR